MKELFQILRDFPLNHNNLPIFRREVDCSSSTNVNVSNNSIQIPDHFFVSGEEIQYRVAGTGSSNAIEIASTSFVSVGTTTKLPGSVYVIKLNESEIQLARTAAEALSFVPTPIDITSVGIGTSHSFTSKKQNSKVVVAIDNCSISNRFYCYHSKFGKSSNNYGKCTCILWNYIFLRNRFDSD